jgi:hypothetical protein
MNPHNRFSDVSTPVILFLFIVIILMVIPISVGCANAVFSRLKKNQQRDEFAVSITHITDNSVPPLPLVVYTGSSSSAQDLPQHLRNAVAPLLVKSGGASVAVVSGGGGGGGTHSGGFRMELRDFADAFGDDIPGDGTVVVSPVMGREARKYLVLYAMLPTPGDTQSAPLTFASLITSRRRLRFIIVPSHERTDAANIAKLRGLVNAAWVAAVAPRGSRSTFLRAEKTKATLVVGERVDTASDVTDIVVLFTAVPRQESATPQSILRSAGIEYSTKDVVPRLVTYFDEQVVGTPVAMDAVAPFLRPDRVLMRDADDTVRPVILAYSPPVVVLRTPPAAVTRTAHRGPPTAHRGPPTAYTAVLDALVSRMFETSEDPGSLLSECTLAVKLADRANAEAAGAKAATTIYDRTRDTVVRMSAALSSKTTGGTLIASEHPAVQAPVLAHISSREAYISSREATYISSREAYTEAATDAATDADPSPSRQRLPQRRAHLVPAYPVAVTRLEYPQELRDSTRSVRQLTLGVSVLEGVTLKFGDRVALFHQTDARENGEYMVVGFGASHPILQSPVVINIAVAARHVEPDSDPKRKWHWRFVSARTSAVAAVNGPIAHLRVGDQIVWRAPPPQGVPAGIRARVSRVTNAPPVAGSASTVVVEAVVSLDDIDTSPLMREWLNPRARCSSSTKVPTMQQCLATWDVADPTQYGPSVARAVWDSPCEHDTDCPYYDESTRRGGCMGGGQCAMPLGVRRVGFRGHDRAPTLKL